MAKPNIAGKWAVVTGASSGFGADFARQLAALGANLVLVARRKERLEELASEIKAKHGAKSLVLPLDLFDPQAPATLLAACAAESIDIEILINNAGFGISGAVADIPVEKSLAMVDLNVRSVVALTELVLPQMLARKSGYILQLASLGAFQSTPTYAVYSASKAFLNSYGEALACELRGTGVSCTVVNPGYSETEFLGTAGREKTLYEKIFAMQSPQVVRLGLRALFARRSMIIPGFRYSTAVFFQRFLPRVINTNMARMAMKS